ncbi:MAG: DUF4382 domain-containing protein, partial [Candidatus Aminicenantes bacterium]|nr:DUF4382 domain-containing protein [Candidatus Aminicenantes bacterium]
KPTDEYQAVYVTIKQIAVHAATDPDDSWTIVAEPNRTFNLMALANGVREQLGLVSLNAGHYTQLRLIIGDLADGGVNILNRPHPYPNYVIDIDGEDHGLKVPSGMQTGVKLVQGFDINENSTTELTFDFDASRSVVVAGNSGKYLLKPTIRVVDTALASVIGGTVTTTEGQNTVGVGGALVSVQVYDATLPDAKDQIAVHTSTFTDDTDLARGAYKFFFAVPSTGAQFNLVASKAGFAPASARLSVENGNAYTQDFELLVPAAVGTVPVKITGASADNPVTISFRQEVTLDGTPVVVEIKSISVVNGDPEPVVLPVGSYSVVSSTLGKTTLQTPLAVVAGTNPDFSISFN